MIGEISSWMSVGKMVVVGVFAAGAWFSGLTYQVNANTNAISASAEADKEAQKQRDRLEKGQIALICKLVPEKCPINQ